MESTIPSANPSVSMPPTTRYPSAASRCVLLASRGPRLPILPVALTPVGRRRTVRDAIAGLPELAASECDPTDPLHAARSHQPIALERLRAIPKDGGSRSSLPKSLALRCHNQPNSFPDVYGRMAWDDVAPTLTTGCTDITRGRFAHPDQDRAITPREAALIQTFPRRYWFAGSSGVVARQIGNAVPCALMHAFSQALRTAIQSVP